MGITRTNLTNKAITERGVAEFTGEFYPLASAHRIGIANDSSEAWYGAEGGI